MPQEIEMFAIRHMPTGHYLPPGRGNNGRGSTYCEPVAVSVISLPRLFHSKGAAERALRAWCKGVWEGERDDGYSYVGNIRPVASRKFADMEIVPITILLR